ncbi:MULTISPECIES: hypothetical protein [Aeromonas]|uniref:Uncharacterized protein n=2 Tax=Aeromonas TaxID=642 RepID=A0A4S5CD27_AERVE|nr:MULTISPECIES: hypothetical protein [Aeromonas]THJ43697.1 hypothetical protein E8Q35_15445 [Aeromonas veronii]
MDFCVLTPDQLLIPAIRCALQLNDIDTDYYVMDGETFPIDSLMNETIIRSYAFGIADIKSHMTLGREAFICTQVATDDGVVISDDVKCHSGSEALVLMTSVWRDTLLCAEYTPENIVDLTSTRDLWLNYLKSQSGTVLDFHKMGYMCFMQEIFNCELIPNCVIDVLPSVLNSLTAAMEVTAEGVRSKNANTI